MSVTHPDRFNEAYFDEVKSKYKTGPEIRKKLVSDLKAAHGYPEKLNVPIPMSRPWLKPQLNKNTHSLTGASDIGMLRLYARIASVRGLELTKILSSLELARQF